MQGFNLFLLPESGPTAAFAAGQWDASLCLGTWLVGGTLHTATPDPSQPGKMMTVPILVLLTCWGVGNWSMFEFNVWQVRLEYDGGRQMVRLTVRTQHGEAGWVIWRRRVTPRIR